MYNFGHTVSTVHLYVCVYFVIFPTFICNSLYQIMYAVKNRNIIPGFPWNFTCLIPENHNGWYWKILHIAQKGLFLHQARKNVPGPAGVLSYHARERNILPKARSWKFSGRFRAGEQIQVRAAPPPPHPKHKPERNSENISRHIGWSCCGVNVWWPAMKIKD